MKFGYKDVDSGLNGAISKSATKDVHKDIGRDVGVETGRLWCFTFLCVSTDTMVGVNKWFDHLAFRKSANEIERPRLDFFLVCLRRSIDRMPEPK